MGIRKLRHRSGIRDSDTEDASERGSTFEVASVKAGKSRKLDNSKRGSFEAYYGPCCGFWPLWDIQASVNVSYTVFFFNPQTVFVDYKNPLCV